MENDRRVDDPLLTRVQAAELLKVTSQSIANWKDCGWLAPEPGTGGEYYRESAIRSAQVLNYPQTTVHGATQETMREAVCAGIVSPAELAQKAGSQKQSRFSLADVEAAKDWWEARSAEHEQAAADDDSEILADPAEAEPTPGPTANIETAEIASKPNAAAPVVSEPHDRFGALESYLRGTTSASELPERFWREPLCPEFRPQAGLFRLRRLKTQGSKPKAQSSNGRGGGD